MLDESHGMPLTPAGARAVFWILGMGKLGARELNVSSDIDLIYLYEADGETTGNAEGRNRISNHEYFTHLARRLIAALNELTADGYVFRVDMRLRPSGSKGPVAVSLAGFQRYHAEEAWTWEHMALARARPLTGSDDARAELHAIIAEVLGAASNADAHHITAPSPGGVGAQACMRMALSDAQLQPSDIKQVNAHGTSTPLNDSAEAQAVAAVFGSPTPPMTSIKGVTGHPLGAA